MALVRDGGRALCRGVASSVQGRSCQLRLAAAAQAIRFAGLRVRTATSLRTQDLGVPDPERGTPTGPPAMGGSILPDGREAGSHSERWKPKEASGDAVEATLRWTQRIHRWIEDPEVGVRNVATRFGPDDERVRRGHAGCR